MNPRTIQAIGLACCVALIAASSAFTGSINTGRERLSMISQINPIESAPPEYAFAIQAFGAFRGLLTNLAFIRAEQYKQEGKYYDAMQLASWITKLQPRFVSVWEFMSWNMAWNISVTTYTPEERWNWVYNGAKLLRDEGLKYNPRAVNMYRQLSWIFGNKMSESVDEHHLTYKRNWAWRMHLLLGPPPDPLGEYRPGEPFKELEQQIGGAGDKLAEASRKQGKVNYETKKKAALARQGLTGNVDVDLKNVRMPTSQSLDDIPRIEGYGVATRAAYEFMKAIADAPGNLQELFDKHPNTRQMVDRLSSELGIRLTDDELKEDTYFEKEGLAFTFFYPYRLATDPTALLSRVLKDQKEDPRRAAADKIAAILGTKEHNPDGQLLLRWLQKKVLHDVYKMDAGKMASLVAYFGPMDWRGVDAHALYWLNEGLIAGDETVSKFGNDKTNTTRQVFFSLRNLFYRNRITFEPYTENVNYAYINFNPDMNFIEPMHKAYLAYGAVMEVEPDYQAGAGDAFRSGHLNFLSEAVRMFYFAGREAEAEYYLDYLRRTYAERPDGSKSPEFLVPLEDFVKTSWDESFTYNQVRAAISQYIYSGLMQLAQGNTTLYRLNRAQAESIHENWHKDTATGGRSSKLGFPSISEIEADAVYEFLRQPSYSPHITYLKVGLWANLYLPVKQAVWDRVTETLKTECERVGFDFEKSFPEPPDMEQYRKNNPDRGINQEKRDILTLPTANQ
jgi:hypothetical protein